MKVINLFGQPGAGKSTTASGLFHLMKVAGYNCELVTEYAKDMVWRRMHGEAFKDQLYISAKQNSRQEVLRDRVDFVITDSPLLLALLYIKEDYYESFPSLIFDVFNSYNNINFFIERSKPYSKVGRNQTEDEASWIGFRTQSMLDKYEIKYEAIKTPIEETAKIIFNKHILCK